MRAADPAFTVPKDTDSYSSWGDAIRGYQKEKTAAPPTEPVQSKSYRDPGPKLKIYYESSNPLTSTFHSPALEVAVMTHDREQASKQRARNKFITEKYQQPFDLVTHKPRLNEKGESMMRNPVLRSGTPSKVAPWFQDEGVVLKGTKGYDWHHGERPIHIISNRYIDRDHEKGVEADRQAALAHAQHKIYQEAGYNLVTGAFVDPTKEADMSRQELQYCLDGTKRFMSKAPTSVKASEGTHYNILMPNKDKARDYIELNDDSAAGSAFHQTYHQKEAERFNPDCSLIH